MKEGAGWGASAVCRMSSAHSRNLSRTGSERRPDKTAYDHLNDGIKDSEMGVVLLTRDM